MLEGLEISEVMLSILAFENDTKRFDAEYFKKEYLIEDKPRTKYKNEYLGNISFITDGQHGYHEVDESSKIRHLTAKNFKNWFANEDGAERLAQWVDDRNKRSSLENNDVILTTRGTVGFCALVKDNVLPANIDQDVARIVLDEDSKILPHYLLSYVNSRFGQDWTKRNQTGMVQQGLALNRVREFPIPILKTEFQNKVAEIIELSFKSFTQAKSAYTQSEALLLKSLGLENFSPSSKNTNIKSFKDSFATTGRLDAEYYQPKYEDYERLIKQNSKGFTRIIDEYDLVKETSKRNKDSYNYIEISDVNVGDGLLALIKLRLLICQTMPKMK